MSASLGSWLHTLMATYPEFIIFNKQKAPFVNMIQPLPNLQNIEASFRSPYITMWLEEDILYGVYADNLDVTLDIAKFCVEGRIFFSKGKSYPLLVDMRGIKSITKEARKYLASIGATLVTGAALITGSPLNRTIGNIFLTVDKPPVPTRLFTSELKAREWLKQFYQGNVLSSPEIVNYS